MAEIVQIRVRTIGTKTATEDLKQLREHVDYLNKTPVVVKVDATGLASVTKYNNSLASLKRAENAVQVATEKRRMAEAELATQAERTRTEIHRTATARERAAAASENAAAAASRLATQEERTRTESVRLATQQERTATETQRTATAQEKANAAMQRGVVQHNAMNDSLRRTISQYVSLGIVISRVVGYLRDAVQEMKAVDTALVEVQKTTGYTREETERLTDAAYELATAYGRTASEILNAAAEYARAGFKANLEDMTELSALLQNVGDLEAKTASKFLIATNAAWKLNGSYDSLLRVIDGLNEQTNQSAVDMDALTSGITVAGAVFANAGESVQTFAGMLGAGVATTARSGSEIARGLRTIAMNVRQIKGELDDGEIIDAASISDAAKALDSVGISVADARGELRLTSDVLGELAKKWNSLTTAEQSYLAQSLAGKRQANILTTLMQNWGEVERQIGLYADGAGSALKENEIYLNSWEAKTKQLSAAWTKFVDGIVSTDAIKGALDGIIKLVGFLDSDVGHLALVMVGVPTLIYTVVTAFNALKTAVIALNGAMAANPLFLLLGLGAGAIYGIVKLADALTTTTEEYAEAAQEAATAYQQAQAEIEQLKSKTEALTDAEKARLRVLEEEAKLRRQESIDAAKQYLASKYSAYAVNTEEYARLQRELEKVELGKEGPIIARMREIESSSGIPQYAGSLVGRYLDANKALGESKDTAEIKKLTKESDALKQEIIDLTKELQDYSELMGDEFPESAASALRYLNIVIDAMDGVRDSVGKAGEETENTVQPVNKLKERLQAVSDAADDMDTAIGGVTEALSKYGENSVQVYEAMEKLEKTIPGATDGLYDFETAAWKVEAAEYADKTALLDFIDSAKQAKLQPLIDEMERASAAALALAGSIALAMPGGYNEQFLEPYRTNPTLDKLKAEKASWDSWIANLRQRSDYKSADTSTTTTGRTSTGSSTDPELARRQGILELRKAELAFLQASGASQDKIVAKQKEIQSALHDVAERMREISGETADTVALSTEWWNAEKAILDIQQEIFDTLKGIIDEYYDAAVTDKEKELSLEEKILEVQKAQVALENAQNERTVRYYNAATGQWERTANRQNVKAAQDALAKAQDDLNKYQKEQAWAEFKSAWEYVADQIKAGAMTFAEAYDYMYAKMKDIQDKYDYDMGMVLEDSIGGFKGLNVTIKDFTGDMAKGLTDAVGTLKAKLDEFTTAIDAFKGAFDDVREKLASGELTGFEDAYQLLYDRALELDRLYGTGMAGALQNAIAGMDRTSLTIDELWKQVVVTLMRANSVNWYGADAATQAYLHAQNEALAKTIGATYDPSGYWSLGGQHLYDPNAGGGGSTASAGPNPSVSYTPTSSGSGSGAGMPDTVYVGGLPFGVSGGRVNNTAGFMEGTIFTDSSGRQWRMDAGGYLSLYSAYDSGGVLRGMGGIKATARDELVLPPDVTAKMLDPVNNEYSLRAIDDLRWMFGLRDRPRGISDVRSLTQNNGATYNFGGITLTEEQARRTTVYEFAQLARGLGSYSHRAV